MVHVFERATPYREGQIVNELQPVRPKNETMQETEDRIGWEVNHTNYAGGRHLAAMILEHRIRCGTLKPQEGRDGDETGNALQLVGGGGASPTDRADGGRQERPTSPAPSRSTVGHPTSTTRNTGHRILTTRDFNRLLVLLAGCRVTTHEPVVMRFVVPVCLMMRAWQPGARSVEDRMVHGPEEAR